MDYLIPEKESSEQRIPGPRPLKSPLEQLIAQGESERVEFKSTMRYNMYAHRKDTEMEREIAKTLCAFMNTEGGTLIIGVDDEGRVLGLDDDFATLGRRKNMDGFEQAFVSIVDNLFESPLSPDNYRCRFEEYQGKLVYVVELEKSHEPVFCLFDSVSGFYVRAQGTTRKLGGEALVDYVAKHFRN